MLSTVFDMSPLLSLIRQVTVCAIVMLMVFVCAVLMITL